MDSRAFPSRESDEGRDTSAHPLHFVIALLSLSIIVWLALSAIGILKSNPGALLGTWPTLLVFGGIAVYAAMHIAGATQVPPRHAYLAIGLLTYPITALFATFGQSLGFGAEELGGQLGESFLRVLSPMGSSIWPLLMAVLGSAAIGILTAKLLREGPGAALKPAGAAGVRFDGGRSAEAFEEDDPFAVPRSPTLRAPRRGLREPVPYPSASALVDEPIKKSGQTATIESTTKAIPEPLIRPSVEALAPRLTSERKEPAVKPLPDPVFELPIFLQRDLGDPDTEFESIAELPLEEAADLVPAAETLRLRDLGAETATQALERATSSAEMKSVLPSAAPRREVDVDWAALELLTQSEAEANAIFARETNAQDSLDEDLEAAPLAESAATATVREPTDEAPEPTAESAMQDLLAKEEEAMDASSVFAAALADQFYSAEGLIEGAEDAATTGEIAPETGAPEAPLPDASAAQTAAVAESTSLSEWAPEDAASSPAPEDVESSEAGASAESPAEEAESEPSESTNDRVDMAQEASFDPWSAFPSASVAAAEAPPEASPSEAEEDESEAEPSDAAASAVDSPAAPNLPPEDAKGLFDGVAAEEDAQFVEAIRLVTESNRCSVAMLQRSLKVSFSEATALIERMYDEGLVGPQLPSGRRKILAKKKGASAE